MEIIASDGRHAYVQAVAAALDGAKRSPRGQATRDAGFVSIMMGTPYDALPTGTGRTPIKAIAAAEALQLIGALATPSLLFKISPNFRRYAEDDGIFHGAYGDRIGLQMKNVEHKLRNDPDTRQAVVTLWDPEYDNEPGKRDYPCTVALQFQTIRYGAHDELCMNVFMRSNDVWLGLPYDLFQFSQLQISLAHAMNLSIGWYRHTTLSLHAYERDVPGLEAIHAPEGVADLPSGIAHGSEPFSETMQRARNILRGDRVKAHCDYCDGWYVNALKEFTHD